VAGSHPDLHDSIITYLREFMQMNLPDPYFVSPPAASRFS